MRSMISENIVVHVYVLHKFHLNEKKKNYLTSICIIIFFNDLEIQTVNKKFYCDQKTG